MDEVDSRLIREHLAQVVVPVIKVMERKLRMSGHHSPEHLCEAAHVECWLHIRYTLSLGPCGLEVAGAYVFVCPCQPVLVVQPESQATVAQHETAVARDKDVVGFDVPVNDVLGVEC